MRKIVFLSALIIFLILNFTFAKAEEPNKNIQLNSEEIKQLQDGAKILGKAFGVQSAQRQEEQDKKQENEPHKTFADVSDKALNMVQKLVVSLSQTLEKVAPQVWRVMVKQQYAKAVADLALPWSLFFTLITYTVIIRKILKWKEEYNNMDVFGGDFLTERGVRGFCTSFVPFVFGFIFAVWGCVAIKSAILLLINPEYYAIRDLLVMIISPGSTQ